LPTIAELLPKVEQRFCVRHLYSNFRKKFPGQRLKELMWSAANATYPAEWERIMREIQVEDDEAYKHLLQIAPRFWSKSRFSTDTKCDTLLNNMSETFNSVILEQREKPIQTMVDDIRTYFMDRWAKNREHVKSFHESVLPRIKARLEKEQLHIGKWMAKWAGEEIFEVRSMTPNGPRFVVDLKKEECNCRKWMLTGIPCVHAIAAIHGMQRTADDYIPAYFRREKYEECYQPVIFPMRDRQMWERTKTDDVLPPDYRRRTGHPKKKRSKDQSEKEDGSKKKKSKKGAKEKVVITKRGMTKKCTKCGQSGHNKRKCGESSSAAPPPATQSGVGASSSAAPPPASQPGVGASSSAAPPTATQSGPTSQPSSRRIKTSARKTIFMKRVCCFISFPFL